MAERSTTEAVRLVNAALAEATSITIRIDTEQHWHSRRSRSSDAIVFEDEVAPETWEAHSIPYGSKAFEMYASSIRNQAQQQANKAAANLKVRWNPATKIVRLWPFEIKVGAEFEFEA